MRLEKIKMFWMFPLLFLLISCSGEPPILQVPEPLKGLIVDSPAAKLPNFNFTDHEGKKFDKGRFKDKWSLVFFGYTNCPDVCPASLTILDKISKQKNIPDNMQTVFISVDPKRDTPKKLNDFVSYFNDEFIGATGEKSELKKFEDLGVIYNYEGDLTSDEYVVNHFAAIYIIDPKARERAYILPPHTEKQVGDAFRLVYDHYN